VSCQLALDAIYQWTKDYRMKLAEGKSEGLLFTLNNKIPIPILSIGSDNIVFSQINAKPTRILGILFDSRLSFSAHIDKISVRANKVISDMRKISSDSFGPSSADLRSLWLSLGLSNFMYCSTVFYPYLTQTLLDKLEVIQMRAARVITGCHKGTPNCSILLQANLLPIATLFHTQTAIWTEKYRRIHDSLLANSSLHTASNSRLSGYSYWHEFGDSALDMLNLHAVRLTKQGNLSGKDLLIAKSNTFSIDCRDPLLSTYGLPPWKTDFTSKIFFHCSLNYPCSKSSTIVERKEACEKTILDLYSSDGPFSYEGWTDGSCTDGRGAGAFIVYNNYKSDSSDISNNWSFHSPSGNLSDSFRPEGIGIRALLDNLRILLMNSTSSSIEGNKLLVVSDSMSVLSSLSSGPLYQNSTICKDIWSILSTLILSNIFSCIHFQFVYSHCGIERNERADRAAAMALDSYSKIQQSKVPIPFNSIKAAIKLGLKRHWKESEAVKFNSRKRIILIGTTNFSNLTITKSFTREDEVLYHQLCTGSCPLIGQYRRYICNKEEPLLCRWCHIEKESVDHIFNHCSALVHARNEAGIIAGREALSHLPNESISFVRLALDLLYT
jgi:hypothetical protein